jgi:tetratricopeptide (TPR) repeat protein
LYWGRHMSERAEAVLRRVLAEDPMALMALEKLMALKRQTATSAEVAEECYQQARHLMEHAGEVSLPGHLRQMARRLLSSALKRVPDSARYLRAMVDCPSDGGDPEDTAFQRLRLAKAYVEAGEMDEAANQLLEAEQVLGPEHSEVQPVRLLIEQSHHLLPPPGSGRKNASTGSTRTERTEAIENFLRVLRLDPDNLEVNQALAITYRGIGNPTGELVHQREVCRLLEMRGRFEELLVLLQDLVTRYPQNNDLGEMLRSVRLKVRAMSLLEGDETQTMLDEEEAT